MYHPVVLDMDTASTSTSSAISPPKKRKRFDLGHLSLAEKQCTLNIYKQLRTDTPDLRKTAIISKISNIVGVAKSTVYRTIKEYNETGTVTASKHRGGRPVSVVAYDEVVKHSVRQIVHAFFYKNELPTLDKILIEIKKHPDLPQMCRSSLYKFIKQINFKYMKRNSKSILIERDDIVTWRRKYLTKIKEFRREGRQIYYLDETWVNEGHTKQKIWIDNSIKNRRQTFIEGLSTGLKNPSGKGKRLIVLHVGSEHGFVDGGLLLFEGKKTGEYHEEMNAAVFETWFANLLPKLPNGAVVIMDNASYHSRKLEKIPTTGSKKKDMQEWLQAKHIEFREDMVRAELLNLIKINKEQYNLYVIDEMAKRNNKIVLRLPPYHCELNPIELIWAKIKNEVASKNNTFKLREVKGLLLQAIDNVQNVYWKSCIEHIIKEETKMCTLDGIVDDLIEPFIISVSADSDSDTFSDGSDLE